MSEPSPAPDSFPGVPTLTVPIPVDVSEADARLAVALGLF